MYPVSYPFLSYPILSYPCKLSGKQHFIIGIVHIFWCCYACVTSLYLKNTFFFLNFTLFKKILCTVNHTSPFKDNHCLHWFIWRVILVYWYNLFYFMYFVDNLRVTLLVQQALCILCTERVFYDKLWIVTYSWHWSLNNVIMDKRL